MLVPVRSHRVKSKAPLTAVFCSDMIQLKQSQRISYKLLHLFGALLKLTSKALWDNWFPSSPNQCIRKWCHLFKTQSSTRLGTTTATTLAFDVVSLWLPWVLIKQPNWLVWFHDTHSESALVLSAPVFSPWTFLSGRYTVGDLYYHISHKTSIHRGQMPGGVV